MRKAIGLLLISMFLFGVASKVLAQTTDNDRGYVIVRCTVTIDVDVLDDQATAWFVQKSTMGALSPNQEDVSISSISVQNKSIGAVLKYAVFVSSIQRTTDGTSWVPDDDDLNKMIKGWYLADSTGPVGAFRLRAVFAKSRPAISDFGGGAANDEFRVNLGGATPTTTQLGDYTYKTGGDNFDPVNSTLRYPSALGNTTGTNAISPVTDTIRGLWFCIHTPAAVTEDYPRRIVITVYGGLGSSW